MDNHTNLVKVYLFVCDAYEKELKYCVQRFSNNNRPRFTAQEILTIMIYSIGYQRRFTIRQVYDFTSSWLAEWFPQLPSYVSFVRRVNKLQGAFSRLFAMLLKEYVPKEYVPEWRSKSFYMVDSMPVITCSAKRSGKVAKELTGKGYCSTKSLYYHGVKLHFLVSRIQGSLPVPERFIITPASENDLAVFRDNWSDIGGKVVFADKACIDNSMQQSMLKCGSELLTSIKYPRVIPEIIKQMNRAADDLFSRAVSSIRQPIEPLYIWLLEKSNIQRASKVRSANGLFVHILAKLAAVFYDKFAFNS